MQRDIEKTFSLPKGILSRQMPEKVPAFVLIECDGHSAKATFKSLPGHALVDEFAVVSGDADVFVRAYGTHKEIRNFLINELYKHDREEIRINTNKNIL